MRECSASSGLEPIYPGSETTSSRPSTSRYLSIPTPSPLPPSFPHPPPVACVRYWSHLSNSSQQLSISSQHLISATHCSAGFKLVPTGVPQVPSELLFARTGAGMQLQLALPHSQPFLSLAASPDDHHATEASSATSLGVSSQDKPCPRQAYIKLHHSSLVDLQIRAWGSL